MRQLAQPRCRWYIRSMDRNQTATAKGNEMEQNAEPKTAKRLQSFSLKVYATIVQNLYAEAGFSDVTALDIAKQMKVTPQAIGGAMANLIEANCIWTEDYENYQGGNNTIRYSFIHANDHENSERSPEDEAIWEQTQKWANELLSR